MLTDFMFAHRSTVASRKQQEKAAEGNQQTTRNTGSHLMAAELSDSTASRELEEHHILMSEIM